MVWTGLRAFALETFREALLDRLTMLGIDLIIWECFGGSAWIELIVLDDLAEGLD